MRTGRKSARGLAGSLRWARALAFAVSLTLASPVRARAFVPELPKKAASLDELRDALGSLYGPSGFALQRYTRGSRSAVAVVGNAGGDFLCSELGLYRERTTGALELMLWRECIFEPIRSKDDGKAIVFAGERPVLVVPWTSLVKREGPRSYADAIEDLVATAGTGARVGFQDCLLGMRGWKDARTRVQEEFERLSQSEEKRLVLLEVSNAEVPAYGYALVVGDELVRGLTVGSGRRAPVEAPLRAALARLDVTTLRSFSEDSTHAPCYFLTVREGGRTRETVVYGRGGDGEDMAFLSALTDAAEPAPGSGARAEPYEPGPPWR